MKTTWAFCGAGERASTGSAPSSTTPSSRIIIFRIPAASCKSGLRYLRHHKGVAGTISTAGGLSGL
jgi:hypothetical protein